MTRPFNRAFSAFLGTSFVVMSFGCTTNHFFYVPEDPEYTIVDSVRDSLRFTVDRSLTRCDQGHIASKSSFLDPEGNVMEWHDFGLLEGPGWAANAVGGAHELYTWGGFLGKPDWQATALGVLDHVLDHGFLDEQTGLIRGYRNTKTGDLFFNYRQNDDWLCPGSMAKIAYQLLLFADELNDDPRAARMRQAATRCAAWIDENVRPTPNGWFPRRCTPTGEIYKYAPGRREERIEDTCWQRSGDGLFIVQLQAALTQRGLADYSAQIAEKTRTFIDAGGFFGSINHDTYDAHENVSYSVAFRTLLLVSRITNDAAVRRFAYDRCLRGLDQFKLRRDRNGVKTKGLLYMEDSWDTAYLWENAEAALAYFEAARDTRERSPEESRAYERDGLTILRAAARHHYGPHGFLTEGVDWNNHVGQKHHIDQARYGAIQYTEPFLNNQHIAEPTLFYLQHLATIQHGPATDEWRDSEGNTLLRKPCTCRAK